jgi:hypothetical protein
MVQAGRSTKVFSKENQFISIIFFIGQAGRSSKKKHLKIPNQNYPLSVFAEKNLEHF